MKQLGTHLVVDAWQSPAELLNDSERIRCSLIDAITAGGATLIDLCVHQFSPHGVTATATLAESHIAIHTWPELGYFAADLFFCGHGNPHKAVEILETALQAKQIKLTEIKRGFDPGMGVQDTSTKDRNVNSFTEKQALKPRRFRATLC
ncbi:MULTISPECIES: adenosylmethionine decarboxylase [Okeania]|uniref:S-adenosylmethionine decarboxylase proenzyme n=1 Tax=Okeania hirsuta TaxID=1458930 RepID=A0A3N6N6R6_9CYAN|nr:MULTISPECIES: adenosylmethionine decarboxylase [Okeania]NEP06199.1 adenosylmethionine decarboxylase [Okeania sp. SIO4D6]NEP38096.1 adenosylmethionine decarboxylase [Okeania sp. SIO2H7]NET12089.1 adenosylmethionine decarboxylase [Okeania sp. SIO1H6]NEP71848.1 adenosylmethionine decarboxylase [Okeania sp. SIO2G5]NEP92868.1 adenosylmethionine decarboxylase [Okeania sp. SIO2F5]